MSDEGFLDWCHRRARYGNKKSQEIRTSKAVERAMEIRAYKAAHPEATVRELARLFECSIGSVSQYLNMD
jgi:hypothetical protein